jgi:hypothetical protein
MLRDFETSWIGRFGSWFTNSTTTTKIRENAFFIVIIQYCIVFFSLYNTNWYCNNYSLIDILDTAIMFVIIYDAFCNEMINKYDDCNIIAFCVFIIIIILNFLQSVNVIDKSMYFSMYESILIIGSLFLGLLKLEKHFLKK